MIKEEQHICAECRYFAQDEKKGLRTGDHRCLAHGDHKRRDLVTGIPPAGDLQSCESIRALFGKLCPLYEPAEPECGGPVFAPDPFCLLSEGLRRFAPGARSKEGEG